MKNILNLVTLKFNYFVCSIEDSKDTMSKEEIIVNQQCMSYNVEKRQFKNNL